VLLGRRLEAKSILIIRSWENRIKGALPGELAIRRGIGMKDNVLA